MGPTAGKLIITDGFKFRLLNREWVAFRTSRTKLLIRCYSVAKSAKWRKKLETGVPKVAGLKEGLAGRIRAISGRSGSLDAFSLTLALSR